MIAALVLACLTDGSVCKTFTGPEMYKTNAECQQSLGLGIALIEERGWIVVDYSCYDWGETI